jgi:hypothetical protein
VVASSANYLKKWWKEKTVDEEGGCDDVYSARCSEFGLLIDNVSLNKAKNFLTHDGCSSLANITTTSQAVKRWDVRVSDDGKAQRHSASHSQTQSPRARHQSAIKRDKRQFTMPVMNAVAAADRPGTSAAATNSRRTRTSSLLRHLGTTSVY